MDDFAWFVSSSGESSEFDIAAASSCFATPFTALVCLLLPRQILRLLRIVRRINNLDYSSLRGIIA